MTKNSVQAWMLQWLKAIYMQSSSWKSQHLKLHDWICAHKYITHFEMYQFVINQLHENDKNDKCLKGTRTRAPLNIHFMINKSELILAP